MKVNYVKVNYDEFVKIEKEINKTQMYIEFYEDHIRKSRDQLAKHKVALIEQKQKLNNLYVKGEVQ